MKPTFATISGLALALLLGGCISTLGTIVTAPVKAVGKAADWATTSQDEADRNRGRELRKQEERLGELARQRAKYAPKCAAGDAEACARVERIEADIAAERANPV